MKIIPASRNIFQGLVLGCAWLVASLSIVFLIYITYNIAWANPNFTGAFFRLTSGGATRAAWGLNYHGVGGSLLAILEALLLLVALWASTRLSDLKRRAGLLFLVLWAMLLFAGGTWVFRDGFAAPFTIPALLVSISRAILCWGPKLKNPDPA